MFGKGAFTMNRQEENNSLFQLRDQFICKNQNGFPKLLYKQMCRETSRGNPRLQENMADTNSGALNYFSCYSEKQLCV